MREKEKTELYMMMIVGMLVLALLFGIVKEVLAEEPTPTPESNPEWFLGELTVRHLTGSMDLYTEYRIPLLENAIPHVVFAVQGANSRRTGWDFGVDGNNLGYLRYGYWIENRKSYDSPPDITIFQDEFRAKANLLGAFPDPGNDWFRVQNNKVWETIDGNNTFENMIKEYVDEGEYLDVIFAVLYYGIPPAEPTPTPEPTPTEYPWGEAPGCAILPELTPITAYDIGWLAQCSDCIPEQGATTTPRPLQAHIPEVTIAITGIAKGWGTPDPVPTGTPSPTIPAICATPPLLRNDTPVMDVPEFLGSGIVINEGECITYIPAATITIPGFLTLWDEFTIGWDKWELCVQLVELPNMRVFDFTVPAGAVVITLIIMLYRRMNG